MTVKEIQNMSYKDFYALMTKLSNQHNMKLLQEVCAIRMKKYYPNDQRTLF